MKKTAKEILKDIKAAFKSALDDQSTPPVAPADTTDPSEVITFSWPVDGADPVYVNASDDGEADIDQNDPVYSDAAYTIPYPDGDYKVTGTDFGFTVSGGIVTAVSDADGKGPGKPADDGSPSPVTVDMDKQPAATAPAAGSVEYRLAAVETELAALKGGYAQMSATDVARFSAAEAKIVSQEKLIKKFSETVEGLFSLVEKLAELPTVEPKTLTGNKKDQFERTNKKEQAIEKVAAALKAIREEAKK